MTGVLVEPLLYVCLAAALLWAAVFDLRERRIPNGAVLALLVCACVQMACAGLAHVPLGGLPGPGERLFSCCAVLIGGVLFELAHRRFRQGAHAVGMGDIKLLAACALWVGSYVMCVLFAASVLALLCELPRHRSAFAFGPYIALAFGTCLLLVAQS